MHTKLLLTFLPAIVLAQDCAIARFAWSCDGSLAGSLIVNDEVVAQLLEATYDIDTAIEKYMNEDGTAWVNIYQGSGYPESVSFINESDGETNTIVLSKDRKGLVSGWRGGCDDFDNTFSSINGEANWFSDAEIEADPSILDTTCSDEEAALWNHDEATLKARGESIAKRCPSRFRNPRWPKQWCEWQIANNVTTTTPCIKGPVACIKREAEPEASTIDLETRSDLCYNSRRRYCNWQKLLNMTVTATCRPGWPSCGAKRSTDEVEVFEREPEPGKELVSRAVYEAAPLERRCSFIVTPRWPSQWCEYQAWKNQTLTKNCIKGNYMCVKRDAAPEADLSHELAAREESASVEKRSCRSTPTRFCEVQRSLNLTLSRTCIPGWPQCIKRDATPVTDLEPELAARGDSAPIGRRWCSYYRNRVRYCEWQLAEYGNTTKGCIPGYVYQCIKRDDGSEIEARDATPVTNLEPELAARDDSATVEKRYRCPGENRYCSWQLYNLGRIVSSTCLPGNPQCGAKRDDSATVEKRYRCPGENRYCQWQLLTLGRTSSKCIPGWPVCIKRDAAPEAELENELTARGDANAIQRRYWCIYDRNRLRYCEGQLAEYGYTRTSCIKGPIPQCVKRDDGSWIDARDAEAVAEAEPEPIEAEIEARDDSATIGKRYCGAYYRYCAWQILNRGKESPGCTPGRPPCWYKRDADDIFERDADAEPIELAELEARDAEAEAEPEPFGICDTRRMRNYCEIQKEYYGGEKPNCKPGPVPPPCIKRSAEPEPEAVEVEIEARDADPEANEDSLKKRCYGPCCYRIKIRYCSYQLETLGYTKPHCYKFPMESCIRSVDGSYVERRSEESEIEARSAEPEAEAEDTFNSIQKRCGGYNNSFWKRRYCEYQINVLGYPAPGPPGCRKGPIPQCVKRDDGSWILRRSDEAEIEARDAEAEPEPYGICDPRRQRNYCKNQTLYGGQERPGCIPGPVPAICI